MGLSTRAGARPWLKRLGALRERTDFWATSYDSEGMAYEGRSTPAIPLIRTSRIETTLDAEQSPTASKKDGPKT